MVSMSTNKCISIFYSVINIAKGWMTLVHIICIGKIYMSFWKFWMLIDHWWNVVFLFNINQLIWIDFWVIIHVYLTFTYVSYTVFGHQVSQTTKVIVILQCLRKYQISYGNVLDVEWPSTWMIYHLRGIKTWITYLCEELHLIVI